MRFCERTVRQNDDILHLDVEFPNVFRCTNEYEKSDGLTECEEPKCHAEHGVDPGNSRIRIVYHAFELADRIGVRTN